MKVAKASPTDMDMLIDLDGALASIGNRSYATMPKAIEKLPPGEDCERFDDEDPEQCQRALKHLLAIVDKGSMFRVAINLSALLNTQNKCIDHSADHLEHYPLVAHEDAIIAALKFYGRVNHRYSLAARAVEADCGAKARETLALFHKEPATAAAPTPKPKPKAIEVGELTTIDCDDTKHTYPYAMLIKFDSPEAAREALESKRVEFTVLE